MSSVTTTPRSFVPGQAAGQRAQAPGAGASNSMGLVTIDPVRLLRRYWLVLAISVFVGAVVGVGAHVLFARYAPRYSATVTFVVEGPTSDPRTIEPLDQGGQAMERFTGTQVALLTSDVVMQAAVNNPDVMRTQWAKPYLNASGQINTNDAATALANDISAGPIALTNLIKLTMTAGTAEDSAVIANKVAQTYLQDLQKRSRSNTSERRDALGKRLAQIDAQLNAARESVKRIVDENGIGTFDQALSQEDMQMRLLNESLVEITKSTSALKSLLEKGQAELAKAGAVVFPPDIEQEVDRHPIVVDMNGQLSNLRVDLRTLRERGFGEDHFSVQQIKDRIRSMEIEIEKKRQELLRSFFTAQLDSYRTNIKANEDQEKDLRTQLEGVNTRREDLLRLKLQKEKLDSDIERLTIEQTETRKAVQDLDTVSSESAFDRVKIAGVAQTPNKRSFPKLPIMLFVGVLLCSGSVTGLIVLREALDQRVRGPGDLALIPRLSVLGMVPDASEDPARPKAVEVAFKDHSSSVVAESFRQIRSILLKRMNQAGARSLVVIGGMPGSGATTVVSNIGMALAGADERVLLIDANLRRPALHKVFKLQDGPGLGDVLTGQATFDSSVQDSGVPNLSILTAGTAANRAVPERLGSEVMSRLIADAASRYDRIIIDSAPAIVSGDGLSLASKCDASVLVVRALNEKRGMVNRLRSTLAELRAEFMGVVVNGVRSSAGGYFRKNIETAHKYHSVQD